LTGDLVDFMSGLLPLKFRTEGGSVYREDRYEMLQGEVVGIWTSL
jgi:hypothetical protein